ncbi:exo-alpha-sialidase [Arthrobacter sp. R1-13]
MSAATITSGVAREWVASPHHAFGRLWRQCHASTVLAIGDRLLCAWFAGTEEGTADNRIWSSRRNSDGIWSDPRIIAGTTHIAHWNPVLALAPNGEVWLFHKRGDRISSWSTWVCTSTDEGTTWGEARELVPGDSGGRGPVKNPPIQTADGAWLAPGSTEKWDPAGAVWECFVDRSTDGGSTWTSSPIPLPRNGLTGAGIIQPALWANGSSVGALMRSTEGRAYVSFSDDGGRTFSIAEPSALPNNNSGLTVARLPDWTLACVHNPTTANWGSRCPLVVSVSDEGRNWEPAVVVEDGLTPLDGFEPSLPGESATGFQPRDEGVRTDGTGEYSYPAAVVLGEDLIITYTWQRRAIACAAVPLKLLTDPEQQHSEPHREASS